jgi:pimeloyl-ACP methyl ester carboxylesterase
MQYPGIACPIEPPAAGRLHEIRAPTPVVAGERDLPMVLTQCEALTQVSGADYAVLPGVGHMSNMEDPEAFNAVMLEFLARV